MAGRSTVEATEEHCSPAPGRDFPNEDSVTRFLHYKYTGLIPAQTRFKPMLG